MSCVICHNDAASLAHIKEDQLSALNNARIVDCTEPSRPHAKVCISSLTLLDDGARAGLGEVLGLFCHVSVILMCEQFDLH